MGLPALVWPVGTRLRDLVWPVGTRLRDLVWPVGTRLRDLVASAMVVAVDGR